MFRRWAHCPAGDGQGGQGGVQHVGHLRAGREGSGAEVAGLVPTARQGMHTWFGVHMRPAQHQHTGGRVTLNRTAAHRRPPGCVHQGLCAAEQHVPVGQALAVPTLDRASSYAPPRIPTCPS